MKIVSSILLGACFLYFVITKNLEGAFYLLLTLFFLSLIVSVFSTHKKMIITDEDLLDIRNRHLESHDLFFTFLDDNSYPVLGTWQQWFDKYEEMTGSTNQSGFFSWLLKNYNETFYKNEMDQHGLQ